MSDVSPADDVLARPAGPDDSARLLAWRNDPQTRRWSIQRAEIAPDAHERWFARVLRSESVLLLVVERAGEPVGTVRYDRDQADHAVWEVSITIAPHARGRGLSAAALAAGERALRAARPEARALLARIRADHEVSLRLFGSAGYQPLAGPPEPGARGDQPDGLVRLRKPLG